jgi:hypothetical protein
MTVDSISREPELPLTIIDAGKVTVKQITGPQPRTFALIPPDPQEPLSPSRPYRQAKVSPCSAVSVR